MDVLLSKMNRLSVNDMASLNTIMKYCSLENKELEYLSWESLKDLFLSKKNVLYVIPPQNYNSIVILHQRHIIFRDYKHHNKNDQESLGYFIKKDGYATTGLNYDKWIKVTPSLIRELTNIDNSDRIRTLIKCCSGITVKQIEEELGIKQNSIRNIIKKFSNIKVKKIKNKNTYSF